ncbi:MAG: transposase [Pirellulales bacterium]|nr:transposase [Pirellulales bacterium]
MTHREHCTACSDVVELLAQHGFEKMAQAIEILMNEAMKLERADVLGAAPYERTDARRGYANGFKPKTVNSRLGRLELQVSQTRGVELIVSDAHGGLAAARKACFNGVPWQRCQFHLQQNAMQYVPKIAMREEVAADLRAAGQAGSSTRRYGLSSCRRPKAALCLPSSERFVVSTSVGIATRPGRPLPGQDFHLLEQQTFSRRTWTRTSALYRMIPAHSTRNITTGGPETEAACRGCGG